MHCAGQKQPGHDESALQGGQQQHRADTLPLDLVQCGGPRQESLLSSRNLHQDYAMMPDLKRGKTATNLIGDSHLASPLRSLLIQDGRVDQSMDVGARRTGERPLRVYELCGVVPESGWTDSHEIPTSVQLPDT